MRYISDLCLYISYILNYASPKGEVNWTLFGEYLDIKILKNVSNFRNPIQMFALFKIKQ